MRGRPGTFFTVKVFYFEGNYVIKPVYVLFRALLCVFLSALLTLFEVGRVLPAKHKDVESFVQQSNMLDCLLVISFQKWCRGGQCQIAHK